MKDYIVEIANALQQGKDVIFYTVGSGTFENIRELKMRFGLLPTAVCDGDTKKQGRTYKGLEGMSVLSPQEALKAFSDGIFYITSLDYKYQIIGYLTEECGIEPERILNYVPVEKIKSCSFLQKALIYDLDGSMRFCWRNPCPSVLSENRLNTKKLLNLRNDLIAAIKEGKNPSHEACTECPQIGEEFYPKLPQSWSVNYFCQSVCNYKCSYCTLTHIEKLEYGAGRHTLGEMIQACKQEEMLSDSYSVILSTAGEPLLHPKRKEFYDAFDGAELVINTNGSVYDSDLAELMEHEKVLLLISVDAGTPETYAQTKGVDRYAFDKIRKNLLRYAEASVGIVALKYLFVPGVNDNRKDVDGFIQFCEDVEAMFVVISVDYFSMGNITGHVQDAIHYLSTELSEQNILCVPYTAWETAEYNNIIRKLVK
ncbi:MAG: radical SAM protein [Firmicutes bacterium]|nr:radical SAM protein [Bacillota bacterium]